MREGTVEGKAQRTYEFPWWALLIGWVLALLPLLMLPLFLWINAKRIKRKHDDYSELFRVQPKLPSYQRIRGDGSLPSFAQVPPSFFQRTCRSIPATSNSTDRPGSSWG